MAKMLHTTLIPQILANMATLSKFFSQIYSMTMLFFSIILLELALFVRAASRTATSGRRSISTEQFLKIIDKNAPAKRYGVLGSGWVGPSECRVCLSVYEDGDEVRKLKCRHVFHKGCLDTWLQQDSATCPLCRREVLPEEVVAKHRRHRRHHLYGQDYSEESDEELMMLLYTLHGDFMSRLF